MTREKASLTGRPSRQRKSVNHYTDSNPSTFTVKRKKGDPEPPSPPDESSTAAASSGRSRDRDRRRPTARSSSSAKPARQTAVPSSSSTTTNTTPASRTATAASSSTSTSTSTFPSNKNKSSNSNSNSNNSNNKRSPKRQRRVVTLVAESADGSSSGAVYASAAVPQDEILSHALTVHPVLPVSVQQQQQQQQQQHQQQHVSSSSGFASGQQQQQQQQQIQQDWSLRYPMVYHNSSLQEAPAAPSWTPVPQAAPVEGNNVNSNSNSNSNNNGTAGLSAAYSSCYNSHSHTTSAAATTAFTYSAFASTSTILPATAAAAAAAASTPTSTAAATSASATAPLSSWQPTQTQTPPPPITCFSVSPDGRVATGDAAGGVTLYRMNASGGTGTGAQAAGNATANAANAAGTAKTRPLCHVRTTSAAAREQERLVTSKRVIRYPNAVTSCHWWPRNNSNSNSSRQRQRSSSSDVQRQTTQTQQTQQQQQSTTTTTTMTEQSSSSPCSKGDLILVWTVDELEALIMGGNDGGNCSDSYSYSDSNDNAYKNEARVVWRIALSPVWSKTAGPLSPSSLDYGFFDNNNNNDSDSASNIVLWTCQGRLPLDETDPDVSLYRLEWKDNAVVTEKTETASTTGGLMDMDMGSMDNHSMHCPPAPIVHRTAVLPIMDDEDDGTDPYTTETWTCLTAIWDTWQQQRRDIDSNNNNNNKQQHGQRGDKSILLVGQSRSRPDHWELMRLHDETNKIQQQTVIEGCGRSTAASVSVTLQQEKGGAYTLLSSHKGIRLYDTEHLTLLQTYGDTVQLHGKTVTWQSALWIPAPGGKQTTAVDDNNILSSRDQQQVVRTTTTGSNKKQSWLERKDELAYRDGWSPCDEHWLVGIPHPAKGPMELNSTMYVWKPGQAQAVTTLQAPVGGLLGVCGVTDFTGWRFLSATADPNGIWECRATIKSDFAGVMYPVGYQVISDNLEYIEDEDELDQIVTVHDEEEHTDEDDGSESADEAVDKDLAEALRLSLLEQQEKKLKAEEGKKETIVSVMLEGDDEDDMDDGDPVACWPDPSLQEQLHFNSEGGGGGKSPVKDSPYKKAGVLSEVFSALPAFKMVQRDLLLRQEQEMERMSPSPTEEGGNGSASSLLPSRPKSKRSRTANVEALLQASIDPCLRRKMSRLHKQWSDGSKSTLRTTDLGVAVALLVQDTLDVAELDGIPTADKQASKLLTNGDVATNSVSGEDAAVPFPETEGKESEVVISNESEIMITKGEPEENIVNGGDSSALLPMEAASSNEQERIAECEPEANLVNGVDSSALLPMEAASSNEQEMITVVPMEVASLNETEMITECEPEANLLNGGDSSALLPMEAASSNETEMITECEPEANLMKGGDSSALLPMEAASSDTNSTPSLAQPVEVTDGANVKETSQPDSKLSAQHIVTSASAEEKELALELLLLSPGKSSPSEAEMSAAPSIPLGEADGQKSSESEVPKGRLIPSNDSDRGEEENSVVVSPSEQSPSHVPGTGGHRDKDVNSQDHCRALSCAACRGRMVIHSCGKREKPVDYEAIARAEKAEKEREEVEKQRIRTEKRRAAEAKRREARRQKKEEADRKMQETQERMRRLEAEQFDKAHIREHEEEPIDYSRHTGQNQLNEGFRPGISPLKTHSTQAVPAFSEPELGQAQVSHGFEQERPYYHQSEIRSTPLTTTDVPHGSHSSQDGYYHYAETPIPVSTSTVHTWNAQQYPSSSFVQDGYYDRSQSAPPNAGQAWEDVPLTSSTNGPHEYRSESAPPFPISSAHEPHDGNHEGFEQAGFTLSTQTTTMGPSSCAPFSGDASELKPSMTLSTTDALAALAGLANSMPVATSHGFGAFTLSETTGDETWTGYSQVRSNETHGPYSEYGSSYGHATGNGYEQGYSETGNGYEQGYSESGNRYEQGYSETGNGYEQGYPEGSYYNEKSWPSHHGSSTGSAPLSSLVAPHAAAAAFSHGSEGYSNDARVAEVQVPPQPPI